MSVHKITMQMKKPMCVCSVMMNVKDAMDLAITTVIAAETTRYML